MVTLIEAYEERYASEPAIPLEALVEFMAANDMKQKDLAELVGSKGNASAIHHGEREISKSIAHKLGVRFNVPHTFVSLGLVPTERQNPEVKQPQKRSSATNISTGAPLTAPGLRGELTNQEPYSTRRDEGAYDLPSSAIASNTTSRHLHLV